jgi:hypothetical protein
LEGVPARLDCGVPAAAAAYDGEDAAGALAAGELPQGVRRGLSAADKAGQAGRGVLLLDEAQCTAARHSEHVAQQPLMRG